MTHNNFYFKSVDNLNCLRKLTKFPEKFSIFCLNAQRICHRNKFRKFISYIDSFVVKPPIIGVTETWFRARLEKNLTAEGR